jgi:predicted SAM-dependent methyltransferase
MNETTLQRVGAILQRHPLALRAACIVRKVQGLARRPYQIRRYFANETVFTGLQIGANHHHLDGWLATDLEPLDMRSVYMDATKRFPFDEGVFDYIVAEHVIEHLNYKGAICMLSECHRVLKGKGVLRISTPDIMLTNQLMSSPLTPTLERYVSWSNQRHGSSQNLNSAIHVVNRLQHEWGHQFLYDEDTLSATLRKCSFTEVTRHTPNESYHPTLRNIDRHADVIGEEFNELESLIVEAVK